MSGSTWWARRERDIEHLAQRANASLTDRLGGPARRRVILILAAVLALNGADSGAVGSMAAQLEPSLHIGNTGLGLLVTATSLVGAIATVPLGVLADRTIRTRLLLIGIALWTIAVATSAFSVSYLMLILVQFVLGASAATAGPTIASLTGDLFSAQERTRIYSFILTGELVGAGFGIVVVGDVGVALGWRAGFLVLAVPGAFLFWAVRRYLPEPARGGQSQLEPGDTEIIEASDIKGTMPRTDIVSGNDEQLGDTTLVHALSEEGILANQANVLRVDPQSLSLVAAVRYILSVRTTRLLILASSIGYFFFAGVRTFAVLFATRRFGIPQAITTLLVPLAGAGAIGGILLGGRLADRLTRRGHVDARIVVPAASYLIAVVLFLPALLVTNVALAILLLVGAAAALGAPNPPLDAARLDVMPSGMWGRAEAVRTAVRTLLEAAAPLLFGYVSEVFGGSPSGLGSTVNPASAHARPAPLSAAHAQGLDRAFLVMLIPLALSAWLVWRARRCYPSDVVAAAESEKARNIRAEPT